MPKIEEPENADRRQQIIEAALKVFSTKGFHKATNKDIAEAAGGISPGLIYWYFKDKEDLFLSIIRERAAIFQLADHAEQLLGLPPREGLALVGRTYLSAFRVPGNVALLRMLVGEAVRFPQIGEMFFKLVGRRFLGFLSQYLQHQVDLGRLRPHDTMIAARSFLGMFVVNVIAREILRQPEALQTSDEQIVATAVDIFVSGLEPAQGAKDA
ncbi:MAG TPA: TetR/AcrR family transcriptional regulator [Kouleothrix sp.]|uniref:TetR/AcrR family transcriptional regulator n=1 Tax=Kouleothrix sp. TaxID=2779161 RepID=UPI002BDE2D76|nr:TetR/AcrR family transcriptional regulator [Kouleothrix sp.]HRC76377.1 TetR/AcrR family transcriptional regulator [Kouleothrix sp.]